MSDGNGRACSDCSRHEQKARRRGPLSNTLRFLKPIPINTRDVGRLLRSYLQAKEPTLVRPLYSTWNAQAQAIKYQELRNAVRDGQISIGTLNRWREQYAELVNASFDPAWRSAIQHGGKTASGWLSHVGIDWQFPAMTNRVEAWVESRGAGLIVNITSQQTTAVQNIIRHMVVDRGAGVDELGKVLRPCIGLTSRESGAVLRMRTDLLARGLDQRAVDHATGNYAGFLHRRRAERIARTEIANAVGEGHLEAFRSAREEGVLTKPVVKEWHTAEDEYVCPKCGPMDGVQVDVDENFDTENGPLDRPPMHPNCRCDILFNVLL